MASRSAVMPLAVILPFIQCHHVFGWADVGGFRKPAWSAALVGVSAARDSWLASDKAAVQPFRKARRCIGLFADTPSRFRCYWPITIMEYRSEEHTSELQSLRHL